VGADKITGLSELRVFQPDTPDIGIADLDGLGNRAPHPLQVTQKFGCGQLLPQHHLVAVENPADDLRVSIDQGNGAGQLSLVVGGIVGKPDPEGHLQPAHFLGDARHDIQPTVYGVGPDIPCPLAQQSQVAPDPLLGYLLQLGAVVDPGRVIRQTLEPALPVGRIERPVQGCPKHQGRDTYDRNCRWDTHKGCWAEYSRVWVLHATQSSNPPWVQQRKYDANISET